MTKLTITSGGASAELHTQSGMMGPVKFRLSDGRIVEPLMVSPWREDKGEAFDALPALMKGMRGEWVCIPFGFPSSPRTLSGGWKPGDIGGIGDDFHGYGAHHNWTLEAISDNQAQMQITYPDPHPVAALSKTVSLTEDGCALQITLRIKARHDALIPIALHPVFRMPATPRMLELDPGPFEMGFTYPGPVDGGAPHLAHDARFDDLSLVPALDGTADLSRLPQPLNAEDIVLLGGTQGHFQLTNHEESYRAWLRYDPYLFPATQLWVSNRGREAYPWNNRFLGLGVEPVRAPFDLGPEIGNNPENPVAKAGYPTALQLREGEDITTEYSIGVEAV